MLKHRIKLEKSMTTINRFIVTVISFQGKKNIQLVR